MWLPMVVFRTHLCDLYLALELRELQTVLVTMEVVLLRLMCTPSWCRVDAGSAPLEVPFLVAPFSSTAVARWTLCLVADGTSPGVLVAIVFDQGAQSATWW